MNIKNRICWFATQKNVVYYAEIRLWFSLEFSLCLKTGQLDENYKLCERHLPNVRTKGWVMGSVGWGRMVDDGSKYRFRLLFFSILCVSTVGVGRCNLRNQTTEFF